MYPGLVEARCLILLTSPARALLKARCSTASGLGLVEQQKIRQFLNTGTVVYVRLSRFSSLAMSNSRVPSPLTHFSTQSNHVSSSWMNNQGRVQSSVTITRVCCKDALGGTKWGNNAVYAGAEDGTVYTDSRARVSRIYA